MSAYICSDEQFTLVVTAWNKHTEHTYNTPLLLELANTLKKENIRSVNYRYNERTRCYKLKATDIDAAYKHPLPSIEQTIQWLRCIDYQSCECPDYENTKAFALNMKMQQNLLMMLVGSRRFDSTKWSI